MSKELFFDKGSPNSNEDNRLCQGQAFRNLLARPEGVFAFGVGNAIDARVATLAGSKVIYAGGWSIAGYSCRPDLGLMSMPEQRDAIKNIVRATHLPVIADIDDGYGDAKNVLRAVSEFFEILEYDALARSTHRLAAVHIEDQVLPKRCGHIAGKELVSTEKMCGKIRAAVRARDDVYPQGVIIARTDAFNSKIKGSMDEAVRRAVAYADSGADMLWCEFNSCDGVLPEEFALGVQVKHKNIPLAFNYSPSLDWLSVPLNKRLRFEDLWGLGYKLVFVTIAAFHASTHAVFNYAEAFANKNEEALWDMQSRKQKESHPTANHQALVGVPLWQEIEREFVPGAKERQEQGEGFKG